MAEENGRTVEQTMWTALRMMRERAVILRRMADYAREQGTQDLADRYLTEADEVQKAADVLRGMLFPAA
jgi:RNase P subunit RPR2